MKYLVIATALLIIAGCTNPSVSDESTNNPNVPVSLLFEHNGCSIYRFTDGRTHYYADCSGSSTTIAAHNRSCGKSCTRRVDEEVVTTYSRHDDIPTLPTFE